VPFVYAVDLDDVPLIDRATVEELGHKEAILAYLAAADFAVPALEVVEARGAADARLTSCRVSVLATVSEADLGAEDRDVPGLYAIGVDRAAIARHQSDEDPVIEAAKDIFHACIPIGNLDHFSFDFEIVEGVEPAGEVRRLTAAHSLPPK
jgi:hypothetical protein